MKWTDPISCLKRLLPRHALGALIAVTLMFNGAAFAYEQIADACHLPDTTIVGLHASDDFAGSAAAAGDLDSGHCCHAHGVVAGVPANGQRLGVDDGLARRPLNSTFYDRAPLAPPVPPPNA